MDKELVTKVLKVALGSCAAITLAEYLRLAYAASAGIITLLTIQNTKRATLKLAITRTISFGITIGILAALFFLFGSHIYVYGIFMILMVGINYKLGWHDVISVNATIGGHALILAENLNTSFVLNEAMLVGIGIITSVVLNFRMSSKKDEIQADINYIEDNLRKLLYSIALHLHKKERLKTDRRHINELIAYIQQASDKAFENWENTMQEHTKFYIEYLAMRRNQCIILVHLYRQITSMDDIPEFADVMADFLMMMSREFNLRNNTSDRLAQLKKIETDLEMQELPKSNDELKGRAGLYQMIKEMEEFLRLKKEFKESLTEEQWVIYFANSTCEKGEEKRWST